MANDSSQPPGGPIDAKEPDIQNAAEQYELSGDSRLRPGGAHGSPVDPGMSSLHHDQQPAGASGMGMEDFGSARDGKP